MNKIYKIILGIIAVLMVGYLGYNQKLRMDESRYRRNLSENGWTNSSESNYRMDRNQYELKETDVSYWTYVMPVVVRGFPLREDKINVIARKNNIVVDVQDDNSYETVISDSSNNLTVTTKIDKNGRLLEKILNGLKLKRIKLKRILKSIKRTMRH